MIDGEQFVADALTEDVTSAAIEQERDVDTFDSLPVLMYAFSGAGQTANAMGLLHGTLELTAIAEDVETAVAVISAGYDAVHAWNQFPIRKIGNVWVSDVTDVSYPSKDPDPDIDGKAVAQYSGSFALDLRSN